MDQARNMSKLSKEVRRIVKKQIKLKDTLLRHEKLSCCDNPSKHLVVANGGLGNGVDREQLWCAFEKFGQIVDIVMKPRKPYAFVSFLTVEEAERAMEELNGQRLGDPNVDGPLLYLLYVIEYDDSTSLSSYPSKDQLPSGLIILENFISLDEELELLSSIQWDHAQSELLKHRRVVHFGYKFVYNSSDIDRNPMEQNIPDSCCRLMSRLLERNLISSMPDQLTVNQYQLGQGIPPHVDTHSAFEDAIVIVNLESSITMEFRKSSGEESRHVSVTLPRFSVVIFSDEVRYQWTHGITPRVMDIIPVESSSSPSRLTMVKRGTRTSLTFRTVRKSANCKCSYPEQCDSQHGRLAKKLQPSVDSIHEIPDIDDDLSACKLESDYVHKVYETIATHFSDTRHTPWPQVASFINELEQGAIVADVGCGNGKYLGVNRHVYSVGCDFSSNLCEICRNRGFECFVCDSLNLPMRSGVCDAVLCIAVIHHLSTVLRRQKAVAELMRVLRVSGKALIYVWALEQERGNIKSKYLKSSKDSSVSETDKRSAALVSSCGGSKVALPVHTNRTAFESQDIFVPWHLKQPSANAKKQWDKSGENDSAEPMGANDDSKVLHRYYHTFVEGELEQLCMQMPNVDIVDSYYDQGNWCIVLRKVK